MSETSKCINNSVILPYQKSVYERLCAVARACLYVDRSSFECLRLRACFLLIGPTGSGKTFLAHALAKEMRVPFLSVSVSDWILLGSSNRGGSATWPVIFKFLEEARHKRGAIIFVDELDKCSHDSNWNAFLRSEVFSLCDSRIPLGINDSESEIIGSKRIEEVEDFLKHKTMIIAGAAFQGIWENQSAPQMGFVTSLGMPDAPELCELAKSLPRELINRFSSEIFVLSQLTSIDYQVMIESMADKIPDIWRSKFLELGISRLDLAVRHQKGARYAEEILLSAIVEVRSCMKNWTPESENPEVQTDDPSKPEMSIGIF